MSGNEIMNFPYAYASPTQGLATKLYMILFNLWLLVFPLHLSCDYGYNQIKYLDFGSIMVWLSMVILIVLSIWGFAGIKRRKVTSFALIYFFATYFLCTNLLVEIGAFTGERFLFQASLGFCILVAMAIQKGFTHYPLITAILCGVLLGFYGIRTVVRNADWKDDKVLYLHDIKEVPNSVRANYNVGSEFLTQAMSEKNQHLRDSLYKQAEFYELRALKLYRHYTPIYVDLGLISIGFNRTFQAADYWLMAAQLDPDSPYEKRRAIYMSDLMYNKGNQFVKCNQLDSAIVCYTYACRFNPQDKDASYNLKKCMALVGRQP